MDATLTFGQWLKHRRQALDLTQAALAAAIGCAPDTVRKIEAGRRRPSRQVADLLAAVLDIPTDERLAFSLWARGTGGATPPVISAPSAPLSLRPGLNLPIPPTPLIGREQEIAQVRSSLWRASTRLVTLTGPPGIGKTRLALAVAANTRQDFVDGVCFVSLAPITDPALVAGTIARSLGVHVAPAQSAAEAVIAHLRSKQQLLLLDNLEQVDAALFVSDLLASSPGLKVLVTSRIPLRLRGEKRIIVPSLALPGPQDRLSPGALEHVEAIALFVERAQEARSDFTLTDRNAGVVADICARLEGLPLAIELAAAKVKLLSLPDLLSRLEHPLQLLTGGARDLPERHQVLSNALQSSYDLLSPRLQRIFPRLGPFVAPFTLQAAESVADAGMEDVASLIDASLLQRQGLASDAGEDATVTRYNMLVTLREFAVQELELRGDLEAARRLHAAYFAQLADTARTELRGAGQKVWMGNLTVMIEDIRAALSWSMECGDAETALRIAGSLFNFWYFLGELTEGRQWLKRALALEGAASADVRAQALHAAGTLAWYQGDLDEGQALLAASLLLRRELGDKAELGRTINNLGLVAHARGEYESALALLTEGLELHREAGDLQGVATSLGNVAMISYVTGNYAQGIEHLKEGLALYRSSGDKFGELRALNDLAAVTIAQGDFARAREYSEESLPLARVLNDRLSTAFALATGGQAARMLGEHEYARRSFAEALVLFQQAGYRAGVAECFENLAAIAGATDNPARSARLYGAAEVLRESIGVPQDPPSVPDYERNVAAARAQSDERSWKEAWAEGRAMPVEQASDYAMEGSAIAERDEHTGWH